MLSTSLKNTLYKPRPITIVALLIKEDSSLKSLITFKNIQSLHCLSSRRQLSKLILYKIDDLVLYLIMISVAKQVHKFSFYRNGILVIALKTELLLENWSL